MPMSPEYIGGIPQDPRLLPDGFFVATVARRGEGWLSVARRALGEATMAHAMTLRLHNGNEELREGAVVILPPWWYTAGIN